MYAKSIWFSMNKNGELYPRYFRKAYKKSRFVRACKRSFQRYGNDDLSVLFFMNTGRKNILYGRTNYSIEMDDSDLITENTLRKIEQEE